MVSGACEGPILPSTSSSLPVKTILLEFHNKDCHCHEATLQAGEAVVGGIVAARRSQCRLSH